MFKISNVEFILLSLIHENGKISGYGLNTLIEERGYREWADIGTTSIYTGLKKLKQKGYVTSAADRYKKGKGPKGVNYMITPNGLDILQAEVKQGLSTGRERERSFVLAVSTLHVLSVKEVLAALEQRKRFLKQDFERVYQKYQQQKAYLPLSGELLFRHSFAAIKNEVAFLETSITFIKEQEVEEETSHVEN